MDKSYHPTENVKNAAQSTLAGCSPSTPRGIDNYEDRELRKYCLGFATERLGCGGDLMIVTTAAENLYHWIKTGKLI